MLKIYTSSEMAKEQSNKEIVYDIDTRFYLRYVDDKMFKDTVSNEILRKIEGMTSRSEDDLTSLEYISTGAKGLLLAANYSDEMIINIDGLGYNCVFVLFDISKDMDIEVLSRRILYHMKPEYKALVNGKECSGRGISIEMEKYDV